ncbi:hypothetical protein L2E82_27556 [Cichorium intybus]|uniref:Uncharacterized protein n=1 Tax=Cichorium intybus TaxID=13427 RepID=A0ACB9CTE5_CICIN|nr:hypothetical protein L2E82_27556 [Cichorium intybus]
MYPFTIDSSEDTGYESRDTGYESGDTVYARLQSVLVCLYSRLESGDTHSEKDPVCILLPRPPRFFISVLPSILLRSA